MTTAEIIPTDEQMQSWNKIDHKGWIEPPVEEDEVVAFLDEDVHANSWITYEMKDKKTDEIKTYAGTARDALIECRHIRLMGEPEETAKELARHKAAE